MKKCSKCGKPKKLEDYYRQKKSSDGRGAECKECWISRIRTKEKSDWRKMFIG